MSFPHVFSTCLPFLLWQFTGWAPLVESWLAQRLDLGLGDWGMGEKTFFFNMKWSHSSWFRITNHLREWLMEIPPIDISKHGENGNSRILKWSYLLVLYHISGHMNWGYIPWNLGRFLRWPGIIREEYWGDNDYHRGNVEWQCWKEWWVHNDHCFNMGIFGIINFIEWQSC